MPVNARGAKIRVQGRLVWAGSNVHEPIELKLISGLKLALSEFCELRNVRDRREGWESTTIV